jgi:hypothetical protein
LFTTFDVQTKIAGRSDAGVGDGGFGDGLVVLEATPPSTAVEKRKDDLSCAEATNPL